MALAIGINDAERDRKGSPYRGHINVYVTELELIATFQRHLVYLSIDRFSPTVDLLHMHPEAYLIMLMLYYLA
jgi:hypothetical protein